jgi:hypothetical protein
MMMSTEVNPGEDQSDHDGHGNNEDGTSEPQKSLEDMEMDVTQGHNAPEGANSVSSKGPDINKLASDFSSGVKFSPRVKRMMEQSKIEIAAFIASLPTSAAAAEKMPKTAAASQVSTGSGSAPDAASPPATAGNRPSSPAMATESKISGTFASPASPVAAAQTQSFTPATAADDSAASAGSVHKDPTAGADFLVISDQPAMEVQLEAGSTAEAAIFAGAVDNVVVQAQPSAGCAAGAASPAASSVPRAKAAKTFRDSSDSSGEVL